MGPMCALDLVGVAWAKKVFLSTDIEHALRLTPESGCHWHVTTFGECREA